MALLCQLFRPVATVVAPRIQLPAASCFHSLRGSLTRPFVMPASPLLAPHQPCDSAALVVKRSMNRNARKPNKVGLALCPKLCLLRCVFVADFHVVLLPPSRVPPRRTAGRDRAATSPGARRRRICSTGFGRTEIPQRMCAIAHIRLAWN